MHVIESRFINQIRVKSVSACDREILVVYLSRSRYKWLYVTVGEGLLIGIDEGVAVNRVLDALQIVDTSHIAVIAGGRRDQGCISTVRRLRNKLQDLLRRG